MKNLFHSRPALHSALGLSAAFLIPSASAQNLTTPGQTAPGQTSLPPLAVPVPAPITPVLISELRARGPRGAQDAFVELFNNTSRPISLAGWSLRGRDAQGASVVFTLSPGTQIGARGHLLLAGRDYSLQNVATSDFSLAPTLNLTRGVRLCDARGQLIDAVGPSNAEAIYREGAGAPVFAFSPLVPARKPDDAAPFLSQFSLVRQAIDGQPQDTNDNARDFAAISVSGAIYAQKTTIGTPGPENSASPRLRAVVVPTPASPASATPVVASTDLDSTQAPPARLIALQTDPTLNSMRRARRDLGPLKTAGTMTLRYRMVNTSANPIKSLSFRVNSITSDPNAPAGKADIRLIRGKAPAPGQIAPETEEVAENGAPGAPRRTVSVWRARLAPSPSQPQGGALNALLNVELPANGIAPGQSGEIWFSFGVEQIGDYRVVVGNRTMNLVFEGNTEADSQTTGNPQVAGNNAGTGQGSVSSGAPLGTQPSFGGGANGTDANNPGAPETGAQGEIGEGIVFEGHTEEGVPTTPVKPSGDNS